MRHVRSHVFFISGWLEWRLNTHLNTILYHYSLTWFILKIVIFRYLSHILTLSYDYSSLFNIHLWSVMIASIFWNWRITYCGNTILFTILFHLVPLPAKALIWMPCSYLSCLTFEAINRRIMLCPSLGENLIGGLIIFCWPDQPSNQCN